MAYEIYLLNYTTVQNYVKQFLFYRAFLRYSRPVANHGFIVKRHDYIVYFWTVWHKSALIVATIDYNVAFCY